MLSNHQNLLDMFQLHSGSYFPAFNPKWVAVFDMMSLNVMLVFRFSPQFTIETAGVPP